MNAPRPATFRQARLGVHRRLRFRAAAVRDRDWLEWIGQRLAAYEFRRQASVQPQGLSGNGLADHRGRRRGGWPRQVLN
jgi:hypothetical protein